MQNVLGQAKIEEKVIIIRFYIITKLQMCYLPVKCLKAIIFIGSFCAIAVSIGLLVLTIYVQVDKKQVLTSISQGGIIASLIVLYLTSLLFLMLGVAGLTGSMRQSSGRADSNGGCLLGVFSIGITVFFLIFMAGTIFFFIGPENIFGDDCTQGSKTSLIQDLYSTSNEAYSLFCHDGCKCKINDKLSALYIAVTTNGGVTDDTFGAQKFADCPNKLSSTSNIEILAALESFTGCAGWCPFGQEQPVFRTFTYRFRNINDCTDAQCLSGLPNCYQQFKDFMDVTGRTVAFGCMVAALVCFINIMAVFCLCCHPSAKKNGSKFYSRMIQED